jgi:hypothetical protein
MCACKSIVAVNRLRREPPFEDVSPIPGQDWWVCPQAKCKVVFCGGCTNLLRQIHLTQAHKHAALDEEAENPEVDEGADMRDCGAERGAAEIGRRSGVKEEHVSKAPPQRAGQKITTAPRKQATGKKVIFAPQPAPQTLTSTPAPLPELKLELVGAATPPLVCKSTRKPTRPQWMREMDQQLQKNYDADKKRAEEKKRN